MQFHPPGKLPKDAEARNDAAVKRHLNGPKRMTKRESDEYKRSQRRGD
jgi:hypothetical protein